MKAGFHKGEWKMSLRVASPHCRSPTLSWKTDQAPDKGRCCLQLTGGSSAPAWASSATWPKLTRLPATIARPRPGSPAVSVLSNAAHSSWTLGCQHLAGFSGRCGELLQGFERQRRRCKPGRAEQPGAAVAHSTAAPGAPSGWTRAVSVPQRSLYREGPETTAGGGGLSLASGWHLLT